MDVFSEKTIKLMIENNFDRYLKLMADCDMPTKNKITLVFMKFKEFEKEANQIILDEAVKRREINGRP